MGALFSKPYQVPYGHQPNQQQIQSTQQRFNSLTHKKNNNTIQADSTATLIDQLQKTIEHHKKQAHQVNEVQASPQPSTQLDTHKAAELTQS